MRCDNLTGALEAVLFACGKPIGISDLATILQVDKPQVWQLLSDLKRDYDADCRGLTLRETGEGWQLVTKPQYYSLLEGLKFKRDIKLSGAAMEALAIVAFKQPITRAEIEAIRGVKSDSVINTLLDLELISEVGRKKVVGNPILLATTNKFLTVFGLKSLEELQVNSSIDTQAQEATQQPLF